MFHINVALSSQPKNLLPNEYHPYQSHNPLPNQLHPLHSHKLLPNQFHYPALKSFSLTNATSSILTVSCLSSSICPTLANYSPIIFSASILTVYSVTNIIPPLLTTCSLTNINPPLLTTCSLTNTIPYLLTTCFLTTSTLPFPNPAPQPLLHSHSQILLPNHFHTPIPKSCSLSTVPTFNHILCLLSSKSQTAIDYPTNSHLRIYPIKAPVLLLWQ